MGVVVTPPKAVTVYLSKCGPVSLHVQPGANPGSPNIGPVWSPNFWTGPESKFLDRSVSRLFSSRSGSASSSLRGGGGDVTARALWMKISAWVRCSPSFEPALLPWPSSPCGGGQSWPDLGVSPTRTRRADRSPCEVEFTSGHGAVLY